MPEKKEIHLVLKKSEKTKKNYCFWDLGWKRIYIPLEDAALILGVSPEVLYYEQEEKRFTYSCQVVD